MSSRPDENQVKTVCSTARTPSTGVECSNPYTSIPEQPNAKAMTAVAMPPDAFFDSRRPSVALIRKPRNGKSGIRYSTRSPLQRRKRVRIERFLVPEQRDDNRQAHGRLGRRDGDYEEHD